MRREAAEERESGEVERERIGGDLGGSNGFRKREDKRRENEKKQRLRVSNTKIPHLFTISLHCCFFLFLFSFFNLSITRNCVRCREILRVGAHRTTDSSEPNFAALHGSAGLYGII